jgi:hypothetical protein
MDSHEKVLKMFSPLKILNSPLSKERLLELFFLSLFFLCSVFLLRMNSGIFEMFEERTNVFSNFLSNGMEVDTPRFMKLGELWKICQ